MKISEQSIRRICSSAIYKRGLEYAEGGRVHIKKRDDSSITAIVDGEDIYSVSVKFAESGEIDDYFCTCPYYETMGSACKHIVAASIERAAELSGKPQTSDENDRISELFITEFCRRQETDFKVPVSFELCFRKNERNEVRTSIRIFVFGRNLENPEEFLECYLSKRPFKVNKKIDVVPCADTVGEQEEKICEILSEGYESRRVKNDYYVKSIGEVPLGGKALERILDIISSVDYTVDMDRLEIGRVPVVKGNPEVLIDISAIFGEITMFASNYGISLTQNASVFYYEGTIYLTTADWRDSFVPVYRAFSGDRRTQITFKNKNALSFATYVLPSLKKLGGVVTDGLGDYVISEVPEFTVFLDYSDFDIKCKIKATYGNISFFLPESVESNRYIVVRNTAKENEIIDMLSGFEYSSGYYRGRDSAVIYDFIKDKLSVLKEKYNVIESDSFSKLRIKREFGITAQIRYNPDVHLLEAVPDTELSGQEIRQILRAVQLKEKYYRSSNGEFYDIESASEELRLFDFLSKGNFDGPVKVPEYNLLYLCAAAEKYGEKKISCSKELTDYVSSIKKVKGVIPEHLNDVLRDYQKAGIDWMKQLSCFGFGGILADDMGLGKTVQMLAFLHGEKQDKPSLIVTPSALTYNWLREINKFIPKATALVIDGTKEDRIKKIETAEAYEFVIVSYALLRRDIDEFIKHSFSFCVLDEAQAIKNPGTMNSRSVKKIKADCRFALTGTPIENSLKELWSIFDYLLPGYLHSYNEFYARYEGPVIREGDDNAMEALKTKIKPFVLRRMKSEVLNELPDKIEEIVYAKMTDEQEKMYIAYRAIAKDRAAHALSSGEGSKLEILTLLLRLRQISCHPALFDSAYKKESGKLNLLYEQLETAVASKHRVLVFSQFTSMLSIIAQGLKTRGITYFYIDGSTHARTRIEYAERFNEGKNDVFLISLKAGGTGLNLTGADTVIHFDPWWNPAVTDQASDRAYRIGQTRNVHVIRLACENTIEAKILELQEKKRNLANDVINVTGNALSSLTGEEILSLFD